MMTNGLNMGLPLWNWVKKIVHWVETYWLHGKEKVLGAAFSKGDADNLLRHEKTNHDWFP